MGSLKRLRPDGACIAPAAESNGDTVTRLEESAIEDDSFCFDYDSFHININVVCKKETTAHVRNALIKSCTSC